MLQDTDYQISYDLQFRDNRLSLFLETEDTELTTIVSLSGVDRDSWEPRSVIVFRGARIHHLTLRAIADRSVRSLEFLVHGWSRETRFLNRELRGNDPGEDLSLVDETSLFSAHQLCDLVHIRFTFRREALLIELGEDLRSRDTVV